MSSRAGGAVEVGAGGAVRLIGTLVDQVPGQEPAGWAGLPVGPLALLRSAHCSRKILALPARPGGPTVAYACSQLWD